MTTFTNPLVLVVGLFILRRTSDHLSGAETVAPGQGRAQYGAESLTAGNAGRVQVETIDPGGSATVVGPQAESS